jgi:Spx/MgsR family transcriptional regulator
MNTLFGIPNCDTVKKARVWLEANNIPFKFHDFRKDGLDESTVQDWLKTLGTDVLVNKRSTSWKQLSDADKEAVLSGTASPIITATPTLIKRPVLLTADGLNVGFKADQYSNIFKI